MSTKEFQLFQKYIEKQCGITIGEEKAYLIESRLTRLLVEAKLSSFEELYYKIYNNKEPEIAEKIIDAITTNETLWFRDKTPWMMMEEVLLPQWIEELRSFKKRKIRIWSAASSTGQEAYSTAMLIAEYLDRNNIKDITLGHFEILGTDISAPVVQVAKAGKYDPISMIRGMDEKYKKKYFKQEGKVWHLDEKIKRIVTFQKFNLQSSFITLGKFDMILCRYVMIYFSAEFKKDLIRRMGFALNPKGIFIIGNSEIISDYKGNFDLKEYKRAVYYQTKEGA